MPAKEAFVTMVANQMMKGLNYGKLPGTPRQRELFCRRHAPQIRWIVRELPRCSAAVAAVLTKCLIKYGEKKVATFCKALKNCSFEGQHDPALFPRVFGEISIAEDTVAVYSRTVCAAKAYMDGRTLQKLRPLHQDIFECDDNWTVPDDLIPGWNPDKLPSLSEKDIEEEVRVAMKELSKS